MNGAARALCHGLPKTQGRREAMPAALPVATQARAISRRPFSPGSTRLRTPANSASCGWICTSLTSTYSPPSRRANCRSTGILPGHVAVDEHPAPWITHAGDEHLVDRRGQIRQAGIRHGVAVTDDQQRGAARLPALASFTDSSMPEMTLVLPGSNARSSSRSSRMFLTTFKSCVSTTTGLAVKKATMLMRT